MVWGVGEVSSFSESGLPDSQQGGCIVVEAQHQSVCNVAVAGYVHKSAQVNHSVISRAIV